MIRSEARNIGIEEINYANEKLILYPGPEMKNIPAVIAAYRQNSAEK